MEDSELIVAALIEMAEALDALKEIFPDFGERPPPTLEGISIDKIEGGEYDGDYELVGLCTRCDGVVVHIIDSDLQTLNGDSRHRASNCNCRGQSTDGYYLPHVHRPLIFHRPVFSKEYTPSSLLNLGLPAGGGSQ